MRNTYLVCYDISDDYGLRQCTRRCAASEIICSIRCSKCQLTRADLARCRHLLSEIIDHREDQVLFVDLGPVEGRGDRVIAALGRPYSPIDSPCLVIERDGDVPAVGPLRTVTAIRRAREARVLASQQEDSV